MSAVVLRGDAAHLPLPDESVDLIVTSPPYFGLRSYADGGEHYDGQIGSEATPREYLDALLACTREWVRVLKPSGSIFVNLGDKYSGYSGENWGHGRDLGRTERTQSRVPISGPRSAPTAHGILNKSLMGLPWRYALGCVDRLGLILRAEIVWQKPNGLPESAQDRVRRSHEQVFHFTVRPRYFSAVDEIREPHAPASVARFGGAPRKSRGDDGTRQVSAHGWAERSPVIDGNPLGKLPGSVWSIPSAPLVVPEWVGVDHFAAYPPELVRRIVLGWSPAGVCTVCGEGRRPVATTEYVNDRRNKRSNLSTGFDRTFVGHWRPSLSDGPGATTITGYACACPMPDAPARPALVLDPFGGTGTTALVASAYGRVGVTVDRSMDYARLAKWRTRDPGERARALGVPKPPPVPDGQGSLFDEDLPA